MRILFCLLGVSLAIRRNKLSSVQSDAADFAQLETKVETELEIARAEFKPETDRKDRVNLQAMVIDSAGLTDAWRLNVRGIVWPPNLKDLVPMDWTDVDAIRKIVIACSTDFMAKGLDHFASSSKSGASFWQCAKPHDETESRVMLKARLRDDEYEAFQDLQPAISDRIHTGDSLLNKVYFGFTAFNYNWLVIEDIDASPVLRWLKENSISVLPHQQEMWSKFDIKPYGSRAPQRGACIERIRELNRVFGDINKFNGWGRIKDAMQKDMVALNSQDVVDESIFLQVIGPLKIESVAESEQIEMAIKLERMLDGPKCAFKIQTIKGTSEIGIVCVTVLDYFLTLSGVTRSLQNVVQFDRWGDYDKKMIKLLSCIGQVGYDDTTGCHDYNLEADDVWRLIMRENWQDFDPAIKAKFAEKSVSDRCCCKQPASNMGPKASCRWISREELGIWGCRGRLSTVEPSEGGCREKGLVQKLLKKESEAEDELRMVRAARIGSGEAEPEHYQNYEAEVEYYQNYEAEVKKYYQGQELHGWI